MPVLVGLAFVVGLVLFLDCVRLVGGVVAYDFHIQNSVLEWFLKLVVRVWFCLLAGRLKLPGLHGLEPLSVLEMVCVGAWCGCLVCSSSYSFDLLVPVVQTWAQAHFTFGCCLIPIRSRNMWFMFQKKIECRLKPLRHS